jgi:hypothetical protein
LTIVKNINVAVDIAVNVEENEDQLDLQVRKVHQVQMGNQSDQVDRVVQVNRVLMESQDRKEIRVQMETLVLQ